MEATWIQDLLAWIGNHPTWAMVIVFLTGFLEALFVIGLLVPGAILLFGFGALVAAGAMDLWTTLAWAFAGAFIGDHLSFFLGYRLRGDLRKIWPISRYPGLLTRGEEFFRQHGGKGVVLGRFIGAVRPLVPTVAGAAGMRPLMFSVMDGIAMLPWLLTYLVPGVIFGASLNLAAEIGTRLLVMLVVAAVAVWIFVWLSRRIFLFISHHAEEMTLRLLSWSQAHRRLGMFGPNLTDPAQPETPGLAVLAFILLGIAWLVYSLLWNGAQPAALDAFVYQLFYSLQNSIADTIALAVAAVGRWHVYLPVSVVVFASLLVTRRYLAAAHWGAALAFGAVLAFSLDLLVSRPEPTQFYLGLADQQSDSSHLILSLVIYGFLAVLLASGKAESRRWRYYGVAVTTVVLIALSQLYLGAQWLSDVIISLSIGTIWVSLLALGYRRHSVQRVASISLMPIAVVIGIIAAGWQWQYGIDDQRAQYRPQPEVEQTDIRSWQHEDYAALPAYRTDLLAHLRYPLNLQWSGPPDAIIAQLKTLNWVPQQGDVLYRSLLWLSPSASVDQLALLPQYHDGRDHQIALALPIDQQQEWVLRLWRTHWQADGHPIWIGSVARYHARPTWRYLRIPRMVGDFNAGRNLLREQISAGRIRPHPEASSFSQQAEWDGSVLLLHTRLNTE